MMVRFVLMMFSIDGMFDVDGGLLVVWVVG